MAWIFLNAHIKIKIEIIKNYAKIMDFFNKAIMNSLYIDSSFILLMLNELNWKKQKSK